MSGIKSFRPSVAGAEGSNRQAPQGDDDKAIPVFGKGKSQKEKLKVLQLVRNYKEYFEELQPDDSAPIRFYYYKDPQDRAAIVITFESVGVERKFSVVEYYDIRIRDLALEIRIDEDLVAIMPEGKETPWFLDKDYLSKQIEADRVRTFEDILNYLAWPFNSLVEDLETQYGGE
jgi:hypothetical protein